MSKEAIESLMDEERRFAPPPAFAASANVKDDQLHVAAAADPEAFWAEQAKTFEWYEPWTPPVVMRCLAISKICLLDWRYPKHSWLV